MNAISEFLADVGRILSKPYLSLGRRLNLLWVYLTLRCKRFFLGRISVRNSRLHQLPRYKISSPNFNDFYWTFKEVFIDDDYYFKTSDPEPFIINLGANIGVDELYFKWLYPECTILSFEAEPENAKVLTENIERNKLENVQIEAKAVGSEPGELKLYGSKRAASLQPTLAAQHETDNQTESVTVPVVTLDTFLQGRQVALLKIDIEGFEAAVIKQLAVTDSLRHINQIVIEFHHFNDPSNKLSDILAALETQFDVTFKSDYTGLASLPKKHTYYFMVYARNKHVVN